MCDEDESGSNGHAGGIDSGIFEVSTENEKLRVHTSGPADAPAIFLFHSLGTSAELWTPQFEALSCSYRLIAMDCRGHGASTCNGGFSIDACVRDALAVLRELGTRRVHVVGISMGGLMAARLAAALATAEAGIHCMSVVSACSYRTLAGPKSEVRLAATRDILRTTSMRNFAENYLATTIAKPLRQDLHDRLLRVISSMDPDVYISVLREILFHDSTASLHALMAPVLVVRGMRDPRVNMEVTQDLVATLRSARVAELDAGHLVNAEVPAAFNEVLTNFFATQSVARS